jgi:hypothetical protein
VLVGSLIGAWATSAFWETVPLVPCVLGAGVLAGAAFYVRRRRLLLSLGIGLAISLVTFLGTAFITGGRWTR